MYSFREQFIPYQLWRFIWLNGKIFLLAKGKIGPKHHDTPEVAPEVIST
jgi:hypothetical protein